MGSLPIVAVASTHPCKVRSGSFGAPQERVVVDQFARYRIVAVTLHFRPERPDHLGVAVVAALANINVPAFQLQRRQGLQAFDRLGHHLLGHQRNDFDYPAKTDGQQNQYQHDPQVLFDEFVHAAASRPEISGAFSGRVVFHTLYAITSIPEKNMQPPINRTT